MMIRRKKIYDGKAKTLYEGPEKDTLIQHFKDDATAFNAEKHAIIDGKGVLNQRICEYIFQQLETLGIRTHFIRSLNMREQLIHKVEIIPVEVVVRNMAAGSLVKRLGLNKGDALPETLIEYFYKNYTLGDPLISEEHITVLGWAEEEEIEDMRALALRVNDFLRGLFANANIHLVDFKLEFGRLWENDIVEIVLADEISPDNCRLWDKETHDSLDKDRFRYDTGDILDAYREVANRLGLMTESGRDDIAGPVLVK